jgi:hypothetical protein
LIDPSIDTGRKDYVLVAADVIVRLPKSNTEWLNPQLAQSSGDSTPPLTINKITPEALFISPPRGNFPNIKVVTNTLNTQQTFTLDALLDSGATSSFIDSTWAQGHSPYLSPLPFPQKVSNADGTMNSHSTITHHVQLHITVQGHICLKWFFVTNLGNKKMIIGIDWLKDHNPQIDWITGKLTYD